MVKELSGHRTMKIKPIFLIFEWIDNVPAVPESIFLLGSFFARISKYFPGPIFFKAFKVFFKAFSRHFGNTFFQIF